jgi:hypothetical protein
MPINAPQGSAQIYKFPPRGRYAAGGNDIPQNTQPANFTSQQAIVGASGAWYHDEAVRDAEQPRKN